MSNLKPQEALEKLRQLTVIMDDLIQLGAWKSDMNMGIDFDQDSREDITMSVYFLEIYDNLKEAYNQINYLYRPIIAEGILTQDGDTYMIGDYFLSETHEFEVICAPEPRDDDYGDLDYVTNPNRAWVHFKNIKEYERYCTADLDGLHIRVRLAKQDVKTFILQL